jgi:hypothetical protein
MLQSESLNRSVSPTPHAVKHLNGSALIETKTNNHHKKVEIPSINELIKPNTISEAVIPSKLEIKIQPLPSHPPTAAAAATVPPQFDKTLSNVSLNASITNVRNEDNRSLSSNDYNSDQTLSQSYPIHYKSTIAPRQTVISRRTATNTLDRAHSVAPYQSSNTQIGSAPISMRPNNNNLVVAAASSSSSIQSPTTSYALK